MLDVAQPRCGLIVMSIAALLDDRLRRQPRDILPCAAEMRCQTVGGHNIVGHHADLVALRCRAFLGHHFGHRSILNSATLRICCRPQRHCNSKLRAGDYVEAMPSHVIEQHHQAMSTRPRMSFRG